METTQDSTFTFTSDEIAQKIILTISAIAFDFDFVTSDTSKSRADEIRVLLVKNKKPPKRSKEGKPGGIGLPTGQLESKEGMLDALKRETRDESGCLVKRIVGKFFVINKLVEVDGEPVPNEIHIFLIEASEPINKVREVDEIDGSVEPWITLRQAFEMPRAQDKNGGNKNPNGIYFSHLERLHRAIDSMIHAPEEELIDGKATKEWLAPNRRHLKAAMTDLWQEGLLNEFLPKDDPGEANV